METTRISMNQTRAKKAWEYANSTEIKNKKEYRSYVRKFPMLVLNSGLVNAVAFAYEKGKVGDNTNKTWAVIYKQLSVWLSEDCGKPLLYVNNNELMKSLLDLNNTDASKIRALTNETIVLFTWLKRFVTEN